MMTAGIYLEPVPLAARRAAMFNSAEISQLPTLEESLDDCAHLFHIFKHTLEMSGNVGIVAIRLDYGLLLPDELHSAIASLIRLLGRKLSGRIAGTYKSGMRDFYLLLIPDGAYNDTLFSVDLKLIKTQLKRLSEHPAMNRQILLTGSRREVSLKTEGIFLSNRFGESPENLLFRAFQDLFGAPLQSEECDDSEESAIHEIIAREQISPLFQRIVNLDDSTVYGYEALSRISSHSLISNSEQLFTSAARYGVVAPLEILCRKKALQRVKQLSLDGRLFLNVSAQLLQSDDHCHGITRAMLDEMQLEQRKVVFELSERTNIEDYGLFLKGVDYYRKQGYSIAIDDLGSGYAGLQMLAEVEPEYVKLARSLISFIDRSSTKRALVESIVMFCEKTGARVIAEGIERAEELEYLRSTGVHMGQGYFIGRPTVNGE